MSALKEAAQVALTKCLSVQAEDIVLVVTDEVCREIGLLFREVADTMNTETLYLEYTSRENHGEEPPIGVAEIMREVDVVLAPTARSISHTDARRKACKAGARIATMPGITAPVLEHCFATNVDTVAQRVRDAARSLHGRSEVHITSEAGTDLRFSMEGARVFQDTGMIRQPGDFGNLPAGKVSLAPAEGSARGDLVIDGSMMGKLLGGAPISVRIEGGKVVSIEGGEVASQLNELFEKHGEEARTFGEFGVGAHDTAQLGGNPLEDEKVMGALHFGFGNNRSLGGKVEVPIHEVGVVPKAKVTVDGRTLTDEGVLNV